MPSDARELRFTVVGLPAPKGSTKSFVIQPKDGGRPRAVTTSDNPRTKGWQSSIANCAAMELRRAKHQGCVFTNGAIELELWFHLPRPKALRTKTKADRPFPHVTKPDLDKLARAAKDALTRVVWSDDSQVTELLAHKRYCAEGEFPRVDIAVRSAADLEDARAPRLV